MSLESFLAAIRSAPDEDTNRLVFADWLDEHDEHRAAARLRWWCGARVRLRDGIKVDWPGDWRALGAMISRADDWRWRLGSLSAIWCGESYFTPHLDPVAEWPGGWSSPRFISTVYESRYAIEFVALDALGIP